jgi:hypothetical protein
MTVECIEGTARTCTLLADQILRFERIQTLYLPCLGGPCGSRSTRCSVSGRGTSDLWTRPVDGAIQSEPRCHTNTIAPVTDLGDDP